MGRGCNSLSPDGENLLKKSSRGQLAPWFLGWNVSCLNISRNQNLQNLHTATAQGLKLHI